MLHQIGIGALGPVFRTYEPTRDRLVAVKVFRLDIVPEQAQALATALGRAAGASLFHPSIVEPIAAGVEGTLAYRAEEYVAAESLDVAMRHYAPAPIDKVLPFITQLAGAIDFARAAGVGHGGLHPRDIFVTPDDARATGFGVIEALEEVGIRAPVRRPYTAPERIDGKAWSTPADIFSLAAITFELLTGRRPAGTGALVGALPDGDAASALHGVLARAMHDDPSQRYSGALVFAAALEAASRGAVDAPAAPVVAIAPPPVPRPAAEQAKAPEPERAAKNAEVTAAGRTTDHKEATQAERVPEQATPTKPEIATEYTGVTDRKTAAEQAEITERERLEPEHVEAVDPVLREPLLFDVERNVPDTARFADDFPLEETEHGESAEPERAEPAEPVEPWEPEPEVSMYDAPESSRPAVLPTAIGVVLGLLAGFAGGYFVGSRDRVPSETTSAGASPSSGVPSGAPSPATGASGAATRERPGQYSEQKVSPPPASATATPAAPAEPKSTEAPPVVQETAPTRGAAPRETPPVGGSTARERTKSTGTIAVKSTPSHAGVTVNGKWRGRTPLTLDRLPFGRYVVRIVQPGYNVAQQEFTLGARDAERSFTATLERTAAVAKREPAAPKQGPGPAAFAGALYVDSRPRGATVLLDGKNVGVTPLELGEVAIGTHVIRVELAGKRPWASTTTVTAGQTARVTMSLEDKQ